MVAEFCILDNRINSLLGHIRPASPLDQRFFAVFPRITAESRLGSAFPQRGELRSDDLLISEFAAKDTDVAGELGHAGDKVR